jgi:hypothetical protein
MSVCFVVCLRVYMFSVFLVKYPTEIIVCPGLDTVAEDISVVFIPQTSVY